MLKKTIKYKDLDGNDVEGDFYFNLTKAEIVELEVSGQDNELSKYLKQIIESENGAEIMAALKKVILLAVGKRHEDGRQFIKNEEIRNEFAQSDAYSVLFMEMVTDAELSSQFINSIVPADIAQAMAQDKPITDLKLPEEPAWVSEGRVPTPDELKNATSAQLQEAFRRQAESQKSQ